MSGCRGCKDGPTGSAWVRRFDRRSSRLRPTAIRSDGSDFEVLTLSVFGGVGLTYELWVNSTSYSERQSFDLRAELIPVSGPQSS